MARILRNSSGNSIVIVLAVSAAIALTLSFVLNRSLKSSTQLQANIERFYDRNVAERKVFGSLSSASACGSVFKGKAISELKRGNIKVEIPTEWKHLSIQEIRTREIASASKFKLDFNYESSEKPTSIEVSFTENDGRVCGCSMFSFASLPTRATGCN